MVNFIDNKLNINDKEVSKGIIYMLIASFLFACMGVFAKQLSLQINSVEIVFFRNVFGVFIVLASFTKTPLKQKGGKPFLLLFRGFIGFVALLMFFYNIANLPLAEAMTFSKISPIFTAIFAFIFVKETLTGKAWIAIFVGFIGIVFITQPNMGLLDKTDYLGVLSGVFAGLAYTSIRELKNYYDTRVIVLSFMITGTIGPLLLMFLAEYIQIESLDFALRPFILPNNESWIYIILLGIFSTFAQIYMTKAYSSAKAGIIGTVGYSNILFSLIFGIFFLGDALPNIYTIIGIILIIYSGIKISKEK